MDEIEQLNHMHKLHLILADELKRICEKNNIKYFMIAGTLLGAIRHQGFIPWDDDMDFGMLREDFEKFLIVCENSLNKDKFFLQTDRNDTYYAFNFAKLRLNGTKVMEEFSSTVNINQGIYIDIFPIDVVPDSKIVSFIQLKKFWFYRNLLWIKCGYGDEDRKRSITYKIAKKFSHIYSIQTLKKLKHSTITKYSQLMTSKVITSDGSYGLKKEILERKWVENIGDFQFEDRMFKGIKDYDAYLKYFYGNYMQLPPLEKRQHHKRLSIDFGKY